VAYVNGKRQPARGYLTVRRGNNLIDVATGLDPTATTTVSVLKASFSAYDEDERKEASPVVLHEVLSDAGSKLVPTAAKPRRLEVLGDSDVSGYGMFSGADDPDDCVNDITLSWAKVLGDKIEADTSIVAVPGVSLGKYTEDDDEPFGSFFYDRTLPYAPLPKWDFAKNPADVVVIFLGTNDMDVDRPSQQPSRAKFTEKYLALLHRVWAAYGKRPSLKIVAACGGTSTSSFVAPSRYCPWVQAATVAFNQAESTSAASYVPLWADDGQWQAMMAGRAGPWGSASVMGCANHWNPSGHYYVARVVAKHIQSVLGIPIATVPAPKVSLTSTHNS
jgi:hypothetical protein